MKNIMHFVKATVRKVATIGKKAVGRLLEGQNSVRLKLAENSGQFSADSAVYIVIAVAVGAVVLGIATGFIQNTLFPAIQGKILGFLN